MEAEYLLNRSKCRKDLIELQQRQLKNFIGLEYLKIIKLIKKVVDWRNASAPSKYDIHIPYYKVFITFNRPIYNVVLYGVPSAS